MKRCLRKRRFGCEINCDDGMSPNVSPYNSEDEEDYEGDVAVDDTDDAGNADEGEPY